MEEHNVRLTGRTRYRRGWFGRLILQVEETGCLFDPRGGGSYSPDYTRWRDAKVDDLIIDVGLSKGVIRV